jgi:endonuclease/exonuclease/phosphatase (EEP) superfamily protein YafD
LGDKATFTSGSEATIDHVLYRGLDLRTLGCQPVPINHHSQDHKAVLARFVVGMVRPQYGGT